MIVDASAIVAILAGEPEAEHLFERLRSADRRLTHPVSLYEAALAIRRLNDVAIDVALMDVRDFLAAAEIQVVVLDPACADAAVDAFSRYGRGRHRAALNMGDCFSYACARLRGVPLLYKGGDFAQTDLA